MVMADIKLRYLISKVSSFRVILIVQGSLYISFQTNFSNQTANAGDEELQLFNLLQIMM